MTSPPPLAASPPPSLVSSSSYSSFYCYTRSCSQGDLVTFIDPFDTRPASPFASPASPTPSRWSWFTSFLRSAPFTPRPAPTPSQPVTLPPSLHNLPLYLFSLRRGCLFGDCFHNADLLQINRLHFAAAPLQDALRLLLPRLILARDPDASPSQLRRIYSGPLGSPPPLLPPHKPVPHPAKPGHRRGVGSSLTASSGSLGLPYVQSMPLLATASSSNSLADLGQTGAEVCTEVSTEVSTEVTAVVSKAAKEESYVQFVPEGGDESTAYFLEQRFARATPTVTPAFTVLPPETLALLSDSVAVLDAEREIFVWIGFERYGLAEDAVLDACIALALSLTQRRNPPAIIRVVKEGSSNSRYVLCHLIPSHKDPMEVAVKTVPVLRSLPSPLLKKHGAKFLRTDDMSFREYMAKIYHFREWCVCWRERIVRNKQERKRGWRREERAQTRGGRRTRASSSAAAPPPR